VLYLSDVDELVVILIIEIKKEHCSEITHNNLSDLETEFVNVVSILGHEIWEV
jgi:hypothetical protein